MLANKEARKQAGEKQEIQKANKPIAIILVIKRAGMQASRVHKHAIKGRRKIASKFHEC